MADANYSVSSMASQGVSNNSFVQFSNTSPQSTSSVRIVNVNLTPVVVDSTIISVQVFGN
jgi:hypothetical protein